LIPAKKFLLCISYLVTRCKGVAPVPAPFKTHCYFFTEYKTTYAQAAAYIFFPGFSYVHGAE
jgi:hypothetical protein